MFSIFALPRDCTRTKRVATGQGSSENENHETQLELSSNSLRTLLTSAILLPGTIFGILRDPYERMVAQFRGTYRLEHPELGCDVDAGVKILS